MSKWVEQWTMPASKAGAKPYVVSLAEDGTWACGCKAWTLGRKKWGDCKHIAAMRHIVEKTELPRIEGVSLTLDDVTVTSKGRRRIQPGKPVTEDATA